MIKLSSTFETFLVNKKFNKLSQQDEPGGIRTVWENCGLTVISLETETGVLVKTVKMNKNHEVHFSSQSNVRTMEELIYLESFINSWLPGDVWLNRDK